MSVKDEWGAMSRRREHIGIGFQQARRIDWIVPEFRPREGEHLPAAWETSSLKSQRSRLIDACGIRMFDGQAELESGQSDCTTEDFTVGGYQSETS
ncbi:hypothetical protein GS500_04120 [Rhodococcus hoagii]|nr:hypothetical protein [Prescottella equi]